MAKGMKESALVVVFITQNYMEKIHAHGDHCYREWNCAKAQRKTILAVPMDEDLCAQNTWTPKIQMDVATVSSRQISRTNRILMSSARIWQSG